MRVVTRLLAPLLLVVLAACSPGMMGGPGSGTGPRGPVQAVPAGTDPDDAVIGRRENPKIIAAYGGVYDDRKVQIMVSRIASHLLQAANQPEETFTVTILDSPQVNAFALPGGYIYVTRGILALANDTSELAAVLAHEISHVILGHARARSNRVRTSQLVDQVITGVLGGDPATDQVIQRSKLQLAAFSQAQELEADHEGIMIAARAGYDPRAASRFLGAMGRFSQFSSGQSEQADDFLSSHPSTPDRIQRAVETARSISGPGIGEADRAGYLAAVDGLTFGNNPDQGAIIGQQFVHPTLHFTFTVPDRYDLQNSDNAVVGIAGDGEAVRFDSAAVPPSMALTDYLNSGWIAGLDQSSVRSENHNGIDMASGLARTNDWAFRVTAVRFDGEVYRFIFAARGDSQAFAEAAQQTIESFRRTNLSDMRDIHRATVSLVTARQGDDANSLARRMGDIPDAQKLFFILNNLFAGDPVTPGQQYKVVTLR